MQGFRDHQRVETESILIDSPIFECECGGLTVRDHDDLPHIFLLTRKDALSQTQSFARIGVVRADLHASELRKRQLFRRVVEEDQM